MSMTSHRQPNLIREDDEVVYGDSGYLGIQKRPEIRQQ